ncbi:MAG TPA: acyclic terpene utilization AtuA family protein [Vicinamibacterales bacterium]
MSQLPAPRFGGPAGRPLRIGCGAGYSGDRIEPAVELVERGDLDVIVFECLAERTIALAQQAKAADPEGGFDPRLDERMRAVLPDAIRRGIRIVTNMGAANPPAAAARVAALGRQFGIGGFTIAVVTGDDVRAAVTSGGFSTTETGEPLDEHNVVSANAYLGAEPIAEALRRGADVVITGRVADPSLFLAPIAVHHGWALDDWALAGRGTLVGHLLECAGQVTGGYFADPGVKDVPALARLGFPLAEVEADGSAVITKVAGSGGIVTAATCTEQLLYEIHDPSAYVTPDVVADFSGAQVDDLGNDRVRVHGASGRPRPGTLKASVGQFDGWIGEGQISYAGPNAVGRGRLASEIVLERLRLIGLTPLELRADLIGVDALHGADPSRAGDPYEVRLRVAARTASQEDAWRVAREVESLFTNGPAGGGGATMNVRRVLAMRSTLIARDRVSWRVDYVTVP